MILRVVSIAATLMVACLCSCGDHAGSRLLEQHPDDYRVVAFGAAGEQLPDGYVSITLTATGMGVDVHSQQVKGVEIEFDSNARHVIDVQQGPYFSGADLFLAVQQHPGLVALGGYHFNPAGDLPQPVRLADVVFSDGPAATSRRASVLPTAATAAPLGFDVRDAGDGTALLTWTFQSLGDYNQDGEVGVSDLTPIGQNFNLKAGDTGWETAALADGNQDGFITASDLTPVGANYQVQITGYIIETATSAFGPFTAVGDPVPVSAGVKGPALEFSHNLASAQDDDYYRVRAYHNSDTSQGAASAALQFNALDPGQNPTAVATADTYYGEAPLSVGFSAAGSDDLDGSIIQYLWDFDGDLVFEYDASSQSGAATNVFTDAGTYTVRLKVIDDSGRWDTDSLTVFATGPGAADPPEAHAHAMPNQGWGPLTVYFSSYGSTDSGSIEAIEWDFDGDGTYEIDATTASGYANHTFTTAGIYNVNLRVTNDHGNQTVDTTPVLVRDKTMSTVDYWTVFADTTVRRITLEVQQADWDLMWDNVEAELEIPSDVTIFDEQLLNCGLKFKGNGSLWGSGEKKPWKVDTNEFTAGQEYQNLKMLIFNNNFDDPSMLREKMAYDMLQFAGVAASFTCYVEIWIDIHGDGVEPIFWGVYTMVERVDKKFVANRFGEENKEGNLYKADAWFEEGGADLVYYGEDINDYPMPRGEIAYGKETNAGADDYTDIIELCRVIDGTEYASETEFTAALEQVLNVDSFLRYMACMVVFDNWDCYPLSANNYYLYNDPGTGKFQWIPWDENSAWAGEVARPLVIAGEWGGPVEYAPLQRKVFVIGKYLRDYAAYIDLLRRNWFTYELVRSQARDWHDLLEPYVKQGTGDKMYFGESASFDAAGFDTSWDTEYPEGRVGIASFTRDRGEFIDEQLSGVY